MKSIDKLRECLICGTDGTNVRYFDTAEIADEIEAEIAEKYMLLPVDAEGVPIHVGDEIIIPIGEKRTVQFIAPNAVLPTSTITFWRADGCTHYHAPTVEDVLIEMMEQAVGFSDAHTTVALNAVSEYADKLREVLRDE